MNSTAGKFEPTLVRRTLWRRVPANVVDRHRPRVGQIGDRSTQGAADSLIQHDENRLIECPYISRGKAGGRSGEEWLGWVIHIELNLVWRPDDSVDAEGGVHWLSRWDHERVRTAVAGG